ncbi:unnamed protein product [Pleuronectes platessa]|uniref:Uncharacterized protein n=1 Tax=Pleuronectes platessa TaxID=8262 RepID=A0A9N7U3H2_PLEPL|nr:unnamed protein product [Pleuronectes platessa]
MEQREAANGEGESQSQTESFITKKRTRRKDSGEDLSLAQRTSPTPVCVLCAEMPANETVGYGQVRRRRHGQYLSKLLASFKSTLSEHRSQLRGNMSPLIGMDASRKRFFISTYYPICRGTLNAMMQNPANCSREEAGLVAGGFGPDGPQPPALGKNLKEFVTRLGRISHNLTCTPQGPRGKQVL